jgi:hypothetical protein
MFRFCNTAPKSEQNDFGLGTLALAFAGMRGEAQLIYRRTKASIGILEGPPDKFPIPIWRAFFDQIAATRV